MLVEILGYSGTALVIISFLCQDIVLLRLLNAIGALFITVYAIIHQTIPVAILDGVIVVINIMQLIRYRRQKRDRKQK